MPIYEYACDRCGTFEVSQRITEKPLRRCPTCKGKVRKLISSTSFQLKGSGWYVTDYAGKNAGSQKGKDEAKSESADSKPGGGDAKAEASSKPDKPAKSESKSEATAA
jgi:putative FmdB family regulatory protein